MTKALTLALGLDKGTVPTSEKNASLESRLADGLHIITGAQYYSDLSYSAFGQPLLSSLVTYYDTNGKAPTSLSTAEFKGINAAAGETVSITYQYKNVSSTKNNDFAFAVFGTSAADVQKQPLARADTAQAYGYTDKTSYATSFKVAKDGTYSLFLANGDDGSPANPAELVIKSITITAPDTGAGAYTVTPAGIARADGSLVKLDGSDRLPDGSVVPGVFSGGSQQIVATLISQDGGGLISQDGGGLISQDGGGLISQDGGGLISQDGGGVVSNDGSSLISQDGGGAISTGGGDFHLTSLQFKELTPPKPPVQSLPAPTALGGDIRVGTAGPVGTNQNDPRAAGLSDGRLAVVWSDNTATAGGTFAVRGQILNPDGTAAGAPFLVSTDGASDQAGASVTGLPNGGFAVSWVGQSVDAAGRKSAPDVHLQVYDATGAKVGAESRVGFAQDLATGRDLFETGARVASLWDGGFVLTLQAQDQGSSAKTGAAVRFDSSGHRVKSFGLSGVAAVGDPSSGSSSQTDLAATGLNGTPGFAVAYRQVNANASDQDGIYLDVFDASGKQTQSQVHVNTTTAGPQGQPAVATLANGTVAVAWIDPGDSQGAGLATLRAQVIDPATGQKVGPEIQIANTLAGGDTPSVTALHDGTFQVTWDAPSVRAGTITGLYLQSQVFSADGTSESPVFTVGTPSPTDADREQAPSVVQLAGGTIAAVGRRGDGQTSGIQADLLTTTGQTATAHGPPSGKDGVAYAIRGFQRAAPHDPVNAHTFHEGDFGFSSASGSELAGVTITTLPGAGTLFDDGTAVSAGQTVGVDDIDSGKLVYETASADHTDHSFTFQVNDTGSAAYGGVTVDPTPRKLTLRYDAPPALGGLTKTVQATAGESVLLAPNVTVSDPDDTVLSAAGINISPDGYVVGDKLSVAGLSAVDLAAGATVPNTNIRVKLNADPEHGFYSLLFTGDDSADHYKAALSSVSYSYAGPATAAGASDGRTIYFDVGDPHGNYNEGYPYTTVTFGTGTAASPTVPPSSTGGAGGGTIVTGELPASGGVTSLEQPASGTASTIIGPAQAPTATGPVLQPATGAGSAVVDPVQQPATGAGSAIVDPVQQPVQVSGQNTDALLLSGPEPISTPIVLNNDDGSTTTIVVNADGTSTYTFENVPALEGKNYASYADTYSADGTLLKEVRNRNDGSHGVTVHAAHQTLQSDFFDTFNNHRVADSTFVFDPGHGLDVVDQFRLSGSQHDTLSFKASDFNNDVSYLMAHTFNAKGGAVIVDPVSLDTVKLSGFFKKQLASNTDDIVFHD